MLDADCAFRGLDPDGVEIHWGAYLGSPDELLVAGPLAEAGPEIERVRAEARARKGWIMDTVPARGGRARRSRGGLSRKPAAASAGPTRIVAVRVIPAARTSSAMSASRARRTTSSSGPARARDHRGGAVLAVVGDQRRGDLLDRLGAEVDDESVAPWVARSVSCSPAGIAEARRP